MRLKPPNESADEALRLIHELQIHQIELELQNEELAQTRSRLEQSLKKYNDLYDFSPIGYFVLSSDGAGTILEVNPIGATLLGVERSELLQQRMEIFFSVESRIFSTPFSIPC